MRGSACIDCGQKMKRPASFCPRCGHPTQSASPDELRAYEIERWRAHRSDSAANERANGARVAPPLPWRRPAEIDVTDAAMAEPAREEPHVVHRRSSPTRKPAAKSASKPARATREKLPKIRLKPSLSKRAERPEPEPQFTGLPEELVWHACPSCDRGDWLVRTGREEDGSWRYWCFRCSRNFKSDVRIVHGRKPFVTAGSILTFLAALPYVL